MEINELRIGNYISRLNAQTKITAIASDRHGLGYVSTDIDGAVTLNQINPIPLTEEWLMKFGFESIDNTCYINGKQWLMQVSDDFVDVEKGKIINEDGTYFDAIGAHSFHENGQMAVNILCRGNYVCKSPMLVHELQNLYFALTGNELEIK